MQDFYNTMKNCSGIDDEKNVSAVDPALDELLRELKPNSDAQNFREFMAPSQNFNKTTPWKQIARKVTAEEQRRRLKSSVGGRTDSVSTSLDSRFKTQRSTTS